MDTCTFFGHRDCSGMLYPAIEQAIRRMVNAGVADFYVGNQGTFDRMVLRALREVAKDIPWVRYAVVLAYFPRRRDPDLKVGETIFPEELESVPPRFAIEKRNLWMLEKSDCVITYVEKTYGGAQKFVSLAEKKGKRIVNLADDA